MKKYCHAGKKKKSPPKNIRSGAESSLPAVAMRNSSDSRMNARHKDGGSASGGRRLFH